MKILIPDHPKHIIPYCSQELYISHFGFLASPTHNKKPDTAIELGVTWAMDNGAFVKRDSKSFEAMLERYQHLIPPMWVVAYDVPGDASETLRLFPQWAKIIQSYGYSVALAAQNGLTVNQVDWDNIQCLFIGGKGTWRSSHACMALIDEAKKRGKWTHLGRVNTWGRIMSAWNVGYDSVDGSSFATHKYVQIPMAINTLNWLSNQTSFLGDR